MITIAAFGNWDRGETPKNWKGVGQKPNYLVNYENTSWKVANRIHDKYGLGPDVRVNICKIPVLLDLIEPSIEACLHRAPDSEFVLGLGEYEYDDSEDSSTEEYSIDIEVFGRNEVREGASCKYPGPKIKDSGPGVELFTLPMHLFYCGAESVARGETDISVDGGDGCCNGMSYLCGSKRWAKKHRKPFGFIHIEYATKVETAAKMIMAGIDRVLKVPLELNGWMGTGFSNWVSSKNLDEFRNFLSSQELLSKEDCLKEFWQDLDNLFSNKLKDENLITPFSKPKSLPPPPSISKRSGRH